MVKLSGPMLAPRSGGAPKQIVVLLHGYGADGGDLIGLGQHWADILPDALFVAPNAPTPCGQNPFGFEWFPIANDRSLSWADGARSATPVIAEFLADLWVQTGLRATHTVLVGFSQGAMMALHVGTAMSGPLAGIVAFSGAFIPPDAFPAEDKAPIVLIHGDQDSVVEPGHSLRGAEELRAAGYPVDLHISEGAAHGIAPDGLDAAMAFLRAQTA